MKELQEFVNHYGLGIKVEDLVVKAYRFLSRDHEDLYTINDRYLHVDGVDYHFTKSRKENRWVVKAF